MPASVDNESEILLGNKQLLAVFAVVANLLAIAFTTGYMLGKNSSEKKAAAGTDSAQSAPASAENGGGPVTQKVTPDDSQAAKADAAPVDTPAPVDAPKTTVVAVPAEEKIRPGNAISNNSISRNPRAGENYVQVTAVVRKVAEATADVLRQHGFAARIAPTPGNAALFRVLVGPSKDAADQRNTEDKLRKIGYTKCFIQHY
jgi:cell division septation protein DedD